MRLGFSIGSIEVTIFDSNTYIDCSELSDEDAEKVAVALECILGMSSVQGLSAPPVRLSDRRETWSEVG